MSARMKAHHTSHRQTYCQVTICTSPSKKVSYNINVEHMLELQKFLEKCSEDEEEPVEWEVLAKKRIEKYKKAGLVLRGMRYRENLSQKVLAQRSGVSQNEISKIENGKRTVGEKVAKKLAKALNTDYLLLLDP